MRVISAIVVGFVILCSVLMLQGCGQDLKFWGSGFASSLAGLNRVISVYTWNGTVIGTYKTKSKIEWRGEHAVSFFNSESKRVDVTGDMIVVSEEI